MTSPALRWLLVGLFIAMLAAAAYFLWASDSTTRSTSISARALDERAEVLARAVMELRTAQQAYVAAGQGDEFWGSRVAHQITAVREGLITLRARSLSADAQAQITEALSALGDFERMDARAREYARGNQRLLASDLIFSDGLEKTDAMLKAVLAARAAESRNHDAVARNARKREALIAAVTGGTALLLVLLLVPNPHRTTAESDLVTTPRTTTRDDVLFLREIAPESAPAPPQMPMSREVVAAAEVAHPIDLSGVAALCGDLARLVDTHSLPAVLERTASVLDASGVVLWLASPDHSELTPIVTHGFPAQLVNRLGTIPYDAENATATAFRTGLLQTVNGDPASNGAIAAPLMTPGGCVGVMAAEVRHGGEKQEGKLAAAAIVAAQLATLVGPPSSHSGGRAEAAGA